MTDKEPKNLDLSKFESIERPVEDKQDESSSNTLGLLMDVELELSAILGSTDMSVKKILELTKGSIIELENKTAEPIDLLVNGKLIGRGEVVIIEDVITTARTIKETMEAIKEYEPEVVAVGCIVDRTKGKTEYNIRSLLQIDPVVYDPNDCPLCKEGIELVKPGSRTEVKANA